MPDAPRRTTHRTGRNGLLLTLPLLAFILVFFAAPIGAMLWRSVSNPLPAAMLPKTAEALAGWDAQALPGEAAYAAIVEDLKALKREEAAKLGAQLNFDFGGLNSLIRKTAREAAKLAPQNPAPRFFLGLAWMQEGDAKAALAEWRQLRADSPPGAPWLPELDARIAAVEEMIAAGG